MARDGARGEQESSELYGHGRGRYAVDAGLSPLSRELEHDFGIANEAEFIAGEAFDGTRVFLEAADLALELLDAGREVRIFRADLSHFLLQAAQARESLGGHDKNRCAYACDGENDEGEDAFDEEREPRHGRHSATKGGQKPSMDQRSGNWARSGKEGCSTEPGFG